MTKKKPAQSKVPGGLIAVLDVGSTKVCCLIAKPDAEKGLKVVGVGHQVCRGVKAGAIVDMDETETSVRATVEAAEQMAGENIRGVTVNLSCGQPGSRLIAYEVSIAGHEVGASDLRRVLDPAAVADNLPPGRETVHTIPVGYSIDGARGVHDPRGLRGEILGVNLHAISAASGPLRNLESAISRCHLEVDDKVVTPYASALATLVEDEKKLGVTCIDMGGGTTSIAVFFDGELVHTDSIPLGGVHVTKDISLGLTTPLNHAERMKTLYGSAMPSPSDDREIIKVPLVGEEDAGETSQVPRSMLTGIIRPRLEETFEMVRARLEAAGFDNAAGRRVVITGGASQLPGARELAAAILDKQVRTGRPRTFEGIPESVSGPAFAATTGLLTYAINNRTEQRIGAYRPKEEANGGFGRFGQWFRENF
jgi:cell division protein FtsA